MFKVIGQRSSSQRKVMYQQQKRYDTAIDKFSSATSNLAWRRNYRGRGLEWLRRPQIAMHSQLPRFLVSVFIGTKIVKKIAQEMPELLHTVVGMFLSFIMYNSLPCICMGVTNRLKMTKSWHQSIISPNFQTIFCYSCSSFRPANLIFVKGFLPLVMTSSSWWRGEAKLLIWFQTNWLQQIISW